MILYFPMNPKELNNPDKVNGLLKDPDWCIQLKRDGVRGQLFITGGGNRIFSRNSGRKNKNVPLEITHNLPTMASWKFPRPFIGNSYDVEIYHPEKTAAELSGALNPNRVDQPVNYESEIEFWCFDMPVFKNRLNSHNQYHRICLYETLFNGFKNHRDRLHTLWYVKTFYKDKEQILEEWLNSGEEGGVLKHLHKEYLFSFEGRGKRAAGYWVKCKKAFEGDFIILGTVPAEKYYKGKNEAGWKYWENESGSLVEINPDDMQGAGRDGMKPVTKFYFNGWIGSVVYGIYMESSDLKRHEKKYRVKLESLEHRSGRELVKIGDTSGMTDELREDISRNFKKKYYKKVITLSGMEQYKDTLAVRHPAINRIRWDKNPSECLLEF